MKEHKSRVWCIRLQNDDSRAISASADGSCIIWDLSTKTRSQCFFESTLFKSIVFHPDESQLLTTGSDRKITYWDTFDGQAIRVLQGSDEAEMSTLSISRSGSHFVSGGKDRILKLWDYDEGVCKYVGVGHSGAINCATMSPDQTFIVSTGSEGAIFIWKMPEDLIDRCHDLGCAED
jgi:WD40 repeat protein